MQIKTPNEYKAAIDALSTLMTLANLMADKDVAPNTDFGKGFEKLASAIEAYEKIHYPFEDPPKESDGNQ